jgi:hypothetical protein
MNGTHEMKKQTEKKIYTALSRELFAFFIHIQESLEAWIGICGGIADWYAGAGPRGNGVRWKKNWVLYSLYRLNAFGDFYKLPGVTT